MSGLVAFYPVPVEEVQFTILGSGSSGNAAYLETPGARVLIDCGFSAKRIRTALLELDRTPERLDGILVFPGMEERVRIELEVLRRHLDDAFLESLRHDLGRRPGKVVVKVAL